MTREGRKKTEKIQSKQVTKKEDESDQISKRGAESVMAIRKGFEKLLLSVMRGQGRKTT